MSFSPTSVYQTLRFLRQVVASPALSFTLNSNCFSNYFGRKMLTLRNQILRNSFKTRFPSLDSLCASSRLFGALNGYPIYNRPHSRFSVIAGDMESVPKRTYQVVVAATRDMGIGKEGKLPWKLPSDLKFFKELTATTLDPTKKNAVVMGRKTWESIPLQFRPLPARLNVVMSRSAKVGSAIGEKVVVCESFSSALESLSLPPYSQSIEKVFVIGGGQVLREALNAPQCDAIHITEIETSIDCDTFIPCIDFSLFQPWYSSEPIVENNVRFAFATYVRVKSSTSEPRVCGNGGEFIFRSGSDNFEVENFTFLPKMIFERHNEHSYLRLVQEIVSSGFQRDDEPGNGTLSRFDCAMQFNLHKCFPLLTTKGASWDGVIHEFFRLISGSTNEKIAAIVEEIKNNPDGKQIILSVQNPSDITFEFCVANGELCCQTHQPSADMFLTVPLNIASYALLTCTIAHVCGLVPGDLIIKVGEVHVSKTHIKPLQEQLRRLPKPFPILKINPNKKDVVTFVSADFKLAGYDSHLQD